MEHRLSRICTRSGDDSSTGLGDGSRVPKDALRVRAYGTVDELNSSIGIRRAEREVVALAHTEALGPQPLR